MRHSRQGTEDTLEAIPASRTGIRFVASNHAGPLLTAHGCCTAVGEQIDDDVFSRYLEDVIVRTAERRFAFFSRGQLYGLDHFYFERLDNGFHPALILASSVGAAVGAVYDR